MKKILKVVIILFPVTVFLALSQISEAQAIPQNKPRYISLAPSTTEILFALGLDEEIVGVSTYCDWPLKAKSKERVGEFSQVNTEKIIFLKPDYIFCTGLEQAPIITQLRRINLKVYVADPKNVRELFDSIQDIGNITGKTKEAAVLIKDMEVRIGNISSKVRSIPVSKRPKVFIEIWHDPLTTAGAGSFINELIDLAGGVNIAADTKIPYSIFSQEEVIKRNPDYIILTYMSYKDKSEPVKAVGSRLGWKGISAVQNNRIYNNIDPAILLRPGPRVAEGIEEVYKRLYQ